MYFDALCYHGPALTAADQLVGGDRLMFGTDHPFFPPPMDEHNVAPDTENAIDKVPWYTPPALPPPPSPLALSHPFQPPLPRLLRVSTCTNIETAEQTKGLSLGDEAGAAIMRNNALRLLGLEEEFKHAPE